MLMSATTGDDCVRTAENWRMTFMRFTLKFITPLERPWSAGRKAVLSGWVNSGDERGGSRRCTPHTW
jgi:hypothetical protein